MLIDFYHITQQSVLDVLPRLLVKTEEANKRALLVMPEAWLSQVSDALWSKPPNGWLPHGVAGADEADAELCRIWLATSDAAAVGGDDYPYVFYLQGSSPSESVLGKSPASESSEASESKKHQSATTTTERVFILFKDEAHVKAARESWRGWKAAGYALRYWQQNANGGWQNQYA